MKITPDRTWWLSPRDATYTVTHTFSPGDPTAIDGIIVSGTVWPSNDGSAIGLVVNDVDVSKTNAIGALLVRGVVAVNELSYPLNHNAAEAMSGITFVADDILY